DACVESILRYKRCTIVRERDGFYVVREDDGKCDLLVTTELQYNVFKAVYDEETSRYASLANRAQLYFSIISLYLGAIAFKFEDVQKFMAAFGIPSWMFIASGCVLLLALLST